ncbi:tetratricopeptide repeat protein [Tychonema sp. LEGE 07203]|uniref:tetratricopeptide repeat protein n=1 Tax=Tychonema sp. LEGE 07203 TaxID=1828671 RepID=UPI001881E266|nr:tetratricopeptide repeat protein [Tychonema sp. LEGE 07203]
MEESEITRLEQQLSVAKETGDRSEECNALGNLGIYLYQLGQFREAVGYCQQYLSIAQEIQNSWGEATAQWYLGYSYTALEKQPEAIEALSQAYRLFRKMCNQEHSEQAWTTLNQLGDSYLAQQQYAKAEELYHNQREVLQEFNDQKLLGWVLQHLGKVQYYQTNYSSAIESHTLMLEIAGDVEDKAMESSALMWLGYDFWAAGQLDSALEYLKQRLALTKKLNDTNAQRETLGWLVNLCKNIDGDGVLPCFYMTEQIELFRQLDDKNSELNTVDDFYNLGMLYFNQQKYQQALACFQSHFTFIQELEQPIRRANARYMLGQSYRNLGQQTEAIENYQRAVELYIEQNSTKEWAAKALDYLSKLYRNSYDYFQAIEQQKKRLELVKELGDPYSEQDALYQLGCIYDDVREHPQALEYFSSALILAKDLARKDYSANAHYMLGLTYEKLGQIDEAIDHTNQSEKLYTETENQTWVENSRLQLQKLENKKIESDPQTWKILGDRLFNSGDYQEAINCYDKLLQPELEPNYLLALQGLGERQLSSGNYYAALASFKKVVELNSSSIFGWVWQGLALITLQQNEEATSALRFALELDRNNSDAWYCLSQALFNLQEYQEALKASSLAVELNANSYDAWNVRGAILANGFQLYLEALDAFNKALSINPTNEVAIKNRSIILSKLGFSQEELNNKSDTYLLDFDFNNIQDWKNLGSLRRSQGRDSDALIAYDQALALNSNNAELWREKGSTLWDLGSLQNALESWNKAIALNPNDFQTYLAFGNALLAKGLNENAVYYFNQALLWSENSLAWPGRCKALSNLGHYLTAVQSCNEAQQRLNIKCITAVAFTMDEYNKEYGILQYAEGLAHAIEAQKHNNSSDYWQKSYPCFQEALKRFKESNLQEWYMRVLQELLTVCRELGRTKEAKYRLYEGVDLLTQLVEESSSKREKDLLSKEFDRLKQWHTDEVIEYKTLFMELLDGVDEGWEQEQILEHLGEHCDNPYLIRWLKGFGMEELEKLWGSPDFDRGYLMIKLGEIHCGELGKVSQTFGYQIIEKTIEKAEEAIETVYQKYQSGDYKEARFNYRYSLNQWSFDYRIVQSCRQECQDKLEHLEEGLVSRYADTPTQADDYLAWFNLGEELRKLEYDEAAIITFRRTLRLTKGQFWEAWASWGWIELKRPSVGDNQPADLGLKFLKRNAPYYQDACGILYEIKGDYYQEGLGVLYEIKGDSWYRYEHTKGPSRGMIPLINIGSLPDYELWRGWWEGAYEAYRKALDCFTTPRLRERRLGVLQKLVKICRCLGKKDEVQHFEQEGSDLLGCLLQEMPSETARLARKFAAFDQYRVDSLAESEKVWQALKFAEWRKNICLRWLASNQWSNDKPDLDEQALLYFSTKITSLLDSRTAIIYWHLSPAAISIFVLKHKEIPKVYVLKNKKIYEAFTNPKPTQIVWGGETVTFPIPTVTEEDVVKGTSGVYDNQLVKFEYWMEEWKKNYRDYRYGKKKEPDETLLEAENKNIAPASHPWREKMLEELDQLAEILHIKEIVDEYLTDIKKLILIPHRDLHLLPLEYLFRDKGFTISRLPSINLGLNLERLRATPTLPPLSIEHPDVGSTLRFAKIESIFLAHLYQIPQENRIADKDATKKRILEVIRVAADIMHFTGHGEHDTDCPAESALILANGDKLTLRDLLNLPLREYYLVCLSACETGLTSTSNLMDEFVGLVSGFLARKTAYVLSTLWRVDELSTALLVIDFYRRFQAGLHPAQALGEAQQWLCTLTYPKLAEEYAILADQIDGCSPAFAEYLESEAYDIQENTDKMESSQPPFADPYYWAGFTITGLVK